MQLLASYLILYWFCTKIMTTDNKDVVNDYVLPAGEEAENQDQDQYQEEEDDDDDDDDEMTIGNNNDDGRIKDEFPLILRPWTFAAALPDLKPANDDYDLLKKMDYVRTTRGVESSMDDRIMYCAFWCCLSKWMLRRNIEHSHQKIWFRLEEFVTDSYWIEVLYHLFKIVTDVIIKVKKTKVMQGSINDEHTTEKQNQVQYVLGVYNLLAKHVQQLQHLQEVQTTFRKLNERVVVMRMVYMRLQGLLHTASGKWKLGMCFLNACLSEPTCANDFTAEVINDMKVKVQLCFGKYLAEEGLFTKALEVLDAEPLLVDYANSMRHATALLSHANVGNYTEKIRQMTSLHFQQPLFKRGYDPQNIPRLSRFFAPVNNNNSNNNVNPPPQPIVVVDTAATTVAITTSTTTTTTSNGNSVIQ